MKAAWSDVWKDQVRARWVRFARWLRLLVTTHADLLRYRLGVSRWTRLRTGKRLIAPRFFFSSAAVPALCALWQRLLPHEAAAAVEEAGEICRHRFDLLGYENVSVGSEIDWHCDPVHRVQVSRKPWFRLRQKPGAPDFPGPGDRRIIWALNRHQHLVTLAKVYRLTGNGLCATEVFCQWRHWHAQNPYPMGVNWVNSREIALRTLSWCWLYFLLADSPQLPPGFRRDWLRAMHVSGRHIERYALTEISAGARVLAEGVALFFIGVLCPELEAANRWKERGWEIILREAGRQATPGGETGDSGKPSSAATLRYFRSSSDHVQRLDLFLHACVLASLNQVEIPPEFEAVLEKMLEALSLLGRGGAPPRLGDDDGGRVFNPRRNQPEHWLDPLATGAILFGRGEFKHLARELREESLWLLGEQGVAQFEQVRCKAPEERESALADAGLFLMANAEREQQLIIDARPQNPVPADCGGAAALSISMNRGGRALLIDPGGLEITSDRLPGPDLEIVPAEKLSAGRLPAGFLQFPKNVLWRGRPRHGNVRNTLLVQNRGRAILPGGMNGGPAPSVKTEGWIKGREFALFVGSHDTYGRRESPVVHRRWIFSLRAEFWLVRDLILGEGSVGLGVFWNLSPDLSWYNAENGLFREGGRGDGLQVLTVKGHGWSQELRQGRWSPVYGRIEPVHVLHFSTAATLPAEFVTLLAPVLGGEACAGSMAKIRQSPSRGVVSGYRYETAAEGHYMFFGQGRSWTLGLWSSDAEFLYWSPSHDGERRLLICCNGSYVEAAGQRVITCAQQALRSEIAIVGERMRVLSSDPEVKVYRQALDGVLLGFAPGLEYVRERAVKRAALR